MGYTKVLEETNQDMPYKTLEILGFLDKEHFKYAALYLDLKLLMYGSFDKVLLKWQP